MPYAIYLPIIADSEQDNVTNFMPRNTFLYIALVFLLVIQAGDLHSHFCQDGQEPSVSLHFENLNGHPEHGEDEAGHDDIENEITTDVLVAKAKGANDGFLVSIHSEFFSSLPKLTLSFTFSVDITYHSDPSLTLPPLRAPPVTA